jgi:hypothetical protein
MFFYALVSLFACLAPEPKIEQAHAPNQVYMMVLDEGLKVGGQTVKLPEPRVVDSADAAKQQATLREIAGSSQSADDLMRASVTAPHIIKVHDVKAAGSIIRVVDLWFVVYGDLAQVDPAQEAARADNKSVEVANMRFETRLLDGQAMRQSKADPPKRVPGVDVWFAHINGRLLDRIEFAVTNEVVASRSAESMVVASRTAHASFGNEGNLGCAWNHLPTVSNPKPDQSKQPYAGGISYAKISRLTVKPGALLVEMHAAFVEPEGWFQGAPILRSKLSLVAQDQIRKLRRDLARKSPVTKSAPPEK